MDDFDDATQPGASHGDVPATAAQQPQAEPNPQEPPTPPIGVVPGRQHLELIFAKRRLKAADESGQERPADAAAIVEAEEGELPPKTPSPFIETQEADQQEVEPARQGESAQPPAEASSSPEPQAAGELTPPPGHRAVKVNGQVRFIPEAEVEKLIGLGLSSTERFQEAARMRDEALRLAASAPPHVAPQPDQQGEEQLDARKLAEALQYGDLEEAERLLKPVVEAANRNRGAEAAIAAAAAQQALEHLRAQTDLARLESEFSDVMSDPNLVAIAGQKFNETRIRHLAALGYPEGELRTLTPAQLTEVFRIEQRKGRAHPDVQILRAIGNDIRAWRDNLPSRRASSPGSGVPTLEERRQAKRFAPQPPRAATARFTVPAQPERRPPTTQEVIAEIRRRRGLPT